MLTITLPLGPSDNRRMIPVRRGPVAVLISSPEYRTWSEEVAWKAKAAWGSTPQLKPTFEAQQPYLVTVYLKDKRSDAANFDKGLRDVLTKAGVWDDDKWCYPIFSPAKIDKENPRIEISFPDWQVFMGGRLVSA